MMDSVMYPVAVAPARSFAAATHFPRFMFHYMELNYLHRQQSANKSWCAHNSLRFSFLPCYMAGNCEVIKGETKDKERNTQHISKAAIHAYIHTHTYKKESRNAAKNKGLTTV